MFFFFYSMGVFIANQLSPEGKMFLADNTVTMMFPDESNSIKQNPL